VKWLDNGSENVEVSRTPEVSELADIDPPHMR